jgi:hypothetical protein
LFLVLSVFAQHFLFYRSQDCFCSVCSSSPNFSTLFLTPVFISICNVLFGILSLYIILV